MPREGVRENGEFRPARTFVVSLLLAVTYLSTASPAAAERWEKLSRPFGIGSTICTGSLEHHLTCFAFRCGMGRGLEYAFFSTEGDVAYLDMDEVPVRVDGKEAARLSFIRVESSGNWDVQWTAPHRPEEHAQLLERLKAGIRMELAIEDFSVDLSLAGSARQIGRTLAACDATAAPNSLAAGSGARQVKVDEVPGLRSFLERMRPYVLELSEHVSLWRADLDLPPDGIDEIVLEIDSAAAGMFACGNRGCLQEVLRREDGRVVPIYGVMGFGVDIDFDDETGPVKDVFIKTAHGEVIAKIEGKTSAALRSGAKRDVVGDAPRGPLQAPAGRWVSGRHSQVDPARGAFASFNYAELAHSALAFNCKPGNEKIETVVDLDVGGADGEAIDVVFDVDGQIFPISGKRMASELDAATQPILGIDRSSPLLPALRAGRSARISADGAEMVLHLSGSSLAIGAMLEACPAADRAPTGQERALRTSETRQAAIGDQPVAHRGGSERR